MTKTIILKKIKSGKGFKCLVKCNTCGKTEWIVYSRIILEERGKFCSHKCYDKMRAERKEKRNICEICGNKNSCRYGKFKGKILCNKHFIQMSRYGKIFERTPFDKNKIINKDNYYEMILYNRKNEEVAKTIFNKNQLEKIKKHKWYSNCGYVATRIDKKIVWLHQIILGKKEGYVIDHKDGNPLNNLNENLRFATVSQNIMNSKNTKGIFWDKSKNKWIAQLVINRKHIHLGYFTNKSDALNARQKGELKYFGEFAPCLNLPKFPQ